MADVGGAGDAAEQALDAARGAARTVRRSTWYQVLVKVGLTSYGIIHLLIAWLAVRLAAGFRDGEASQTGALRELAETPAGGVTLWVVAVGFFALVLWQVVTLLVGHREFQGLKRWRKRGSSALRAILYGSLGVAAAEVALGPEVDDGDDFEEEVSAGLLQLPFGQVLVALVGTAVLGYAVRQFVKGFRGSFNDDLERDLEGVGRWLAALGHVARGVGLGVVGGLFWWAALTVDPEKAGGIDQALSLLLAQPFGVGLLATVAAGLALYGLYCFYWAAHAKNA